jgi:hypothetical protein
MGSGSSCYSNQVAVDPIAKSRAKSPPNSPLVIPTGYQPSTAFQKIAFFNNKCYDSPRIRGISYPNTLQLPNGHSVRAQSDQNPDTPKSPIQYSPCSADPRFTQNSLRSGVAESFSFGIGNSQRGTKSLYHWDSVREIYVPRFPDSVLVGIEAVINTFPMVMGKRSEPETVTINAQSKQSSQNEGISNHKNIPERITSGSVPTKNLASPRPFGRLDSLSFGKKTPDSGSELKSWAEKSSPKQMNKHRLSKIGTDDLGLSLDSEPTPNNQKFIDHLVKGHDLTIQELEARNLKNEEKILQLTQQIDTPQMILQMSETPNQLNQNS